MKFWILTFLPVQKHFTIFKHTETKIQFYPKLSMALQCQDRKLLCQILLKQFII